MKFLAISTTNARTLGWRIIATGDTRREAAEAAEAELAQLGADIYAETMRRNLVVVARSAAERHGVSEYEVERYLDARDARDAGREQAAASR